MDNAANQDPKASHLDHLYNDAYLLNLSVRTIAPSIDAYLESHPTIRGKLIDVGCGNGSMLRHFRDRFGDRFQYTGMDFFQNTDPQAQNPIHFEKRDLNQDFAAGGEGQYDVVVSCEVIEHVVDTDHFILNVKKLLKPGGTLLITTPNLASFFNRILLVMGFQPLHTEVSWKNPYLGRESLYRLIGQDPAPPAGHLRLFTYGALVEFLKYHGFQVEHRGAFSPYDGVMGKVSRVFSWAPSLMPGIFLGARVAPSLSTPPLRGGLEQI